jgi:cytochrome c-type biogenesis protein CcmH/NrfG
VTTVRETGRFPSPKLPEEMSLPPELAGLGTCLAVLATGNATAIGEEMGAFLAANPKSVRGYLLLGLWRLHGEGDPEAALAALRHAVRLDPDYLPAARECADLLAGLHPEQLDDFLKRHAERASNKERAFRLRTAETEG